MKIISNNKLSFGFTKVLVLGIAAFIVIVGGIIYFSTANQEETMMEKEDSMMEEGKMMDDSGKNMMGGQESMMANYAGAVLAGTQALLLDFNKADYDAALASDKFLVLYFYANWCPICKAEFPKMQAVFNELTNDQIIGFRINYNDNETDDDERNLAREFGVAYQHTKVFLKNRERILKSPEEWDKNRYLSEINKALGQ